LPEEICGFLKPLLNLITEMSDRIKSYDKEVRRIAKTDHPETAVLQQVGGVGDLTSLAYVLTIEDRERFRKSRDVGAYLGLVPRQDDSGETSKQLGPFGEDCDLRRFGLKLAERGGKNAKKRAVVAVARKLSVLLHRLWVTGEVYEPLRTTGPAVVAEA
jgi:transposase